MKSLLAGIRRLPPHRITIRVPRHDRAWTGPSATSPSTIQFVTRLVHGLSPSIIHHADEPFDSALVLSPSTLVQTTRPLLGHLFRSRRIGRRFEIEGHYLPQLLKLARAQIHRSRQKDDAGDARFDNFYFVRSAL